MIIFLITFCIVELIAIIVLAYLFRLYYNISCEVIEQQNFDLSTYSKIIEKLQDRNDRPWLYDDKEWG